MTEHLTAKDLPRLRKLARAHGWNVTTVRPARRRAGIDLLATRLYREGYSEGNESRHPMIQYVAVTVAFDGTLHATNSYHNGLYPSIEPDVEARLTSVPPAQEVTS